jgi:hypothetical protein
MLCFIFKWKISRALETGKPLSGRTRRHLAGCAACREFYRLGEEMEHRLTDDAASLLSNPRPQLAERVRRAIGESGTTSVHTPPRLASRALKPAFAATVVLAVIGASLFWLVRSRPSGMPPLNPLLKIEGRRADFVSAMERAESPYHQEIQELKKTFQSTADYLAACFNIKLGGVTK